MSILCTIFTSIAINSIDVNVKELYYVVVRWSLFYFYSFFTLFLIYIRMFLKIVHVYWYTFFSRENHLYIGYCWTEDSQIQRGGFVLDIFYHNHCSIAIQSISVVWNHSVVILMTIFSVYQIWFWAPCKFFGTFQLPRAQSTDSSFVIFRKKFAGRRVYGPEGLALDFTNFLQARGDTSNNEASESLRRVLDWHGFTVTKPLLTVLFNFLLPVTCIFGFCYRPAWLFDYLTIYICLLIITIKYWVLIYGAFLIFFFVGPARGSYLVY